MTCVTCVVSTTRSSSVGVKRELEKKMKMEMYNWCLQE